MAFQGYQYNYLVASSNNRSCTVLGHFLVAVEKYSLPSRVRGGEVKMWLFQSIC